MSSPIFVYMNDFALIEKYNVPVPRYTSYPTVPHWSLDNPDQREWITSLNVALKEDNEISLYIHLPFCEQLCTYCACNKRITKNHNVEVPYINAVLDEFKFYIENLDTVPVIKELHLGGGTPTFFSASELTRLINGISELCKISKDKSFSLEVHPNTTSVEQLKALRKVGFNRVSIGVQDINEFILSAINRDQTIEQIVRLTDASREFGYESINYDIIYGLPFQRIEDIQNTMYFIENTKPDRLAFYSYAHVPWKSKGQRAFSDEDVPDGLEKISLRLEGERLLKQMGYHLVGMDHYALESDSLYKALQNGNLHRNFMGFTDCSTEVLIGLGASAISESLDMYVQNEKNVEEYQRVIKKGRLALTKGHTLNAKEKSIKKQILSLMCQSKLKRSTSDDYDNLNFTALNEKQNEGMIEIHADSIVVTPVGRPFLRNICADIDPYYKEANDSKFSKAL